MKSIKVKEWFYDKEASKAKVYNIFFNVEYKDGMINRENEMVTLSSVDVLAETEKAIKVEIATGAVVGSSKGWTTWIPKSVIA